MADGKTTLTGPMAEMLRPGEQLIGGCKAAGKNAVLKGAVGGLASAAIPGSRSGGLGAGVPQEKIFWIGATNQRLVYLGSEPSPRRPRSSSARPRSRLSSPSPSPGS